MNRTTKNRKRKSQHRRRSARSVGRFSPPRTMEEFRAMPEQLQEEWNRVNHVITRMRADAVSLRQAARHFDIAPRKVMRLAGRVLRKQANGHFTPTARDSRLRVLYVPTQDGVGEVGVRDSRQASLLAEYWDAVQRYLQIGDKSSLSKFEGKHITDASGTVVPFLTNPEELSRLGSAGVLSFESLYARSA